MPIVRVKMWAAKCRECGSRVESPDGYFDYLRRKQVYDAFVDIREEYGGLERAITELCGCLKRKEK